MIEEDEINDVFYLYKLISEQTCPICNKKSPITIVKNRFVIGVIFISHQETYYKLGCKKCLKLHLIKSTLITLFFGWWSIPFGFVHTIFTILKNIKKIVFLQNSNTDFLKFISIHKESIDKIINSESEFINFLQKSKHKIYDL